MFEYLWLTIFPSPYILFSIPRNPISHINEHLNHFKYHHYKLLMLYAYIDVRFNWLHPNKYFVPFDIWIGWKDAKQLIASLYTFMQINPAMVPFKTRPFPSTIVFTIQCLKISGLEFGSKHSNEMICKHVNPAEIRINHMFIVIFVSVTIFQT